MFRFPCSYAAATVLFAAFLAVALLADADAQPTASANYSANSLVPACQDFIATGEGRAEGRARRVDTAFTQGVCLGIIAELYSVGTLLRGLC
jgi:hypothetical protein